MADKKLNEVTTVNSGTLANVKNFLAVMKDGSIQQMSKEDMASVVGGLISTLGLYPFMDKGSLSEWTDLNTITSPGVYSTNGGKNFPDTKDSYPVAFSILRVYKSGSAMIQEITNVTLSYCNNYFIRVSKDGGKTWYSWRKIDISVGNEYESTE